jgi:transposase InsO family protein
MLLSQRTPVRPIEERMPRPVTRALNSAEVQTLPRSELSRIRLNSDAGSQYTSIRYTDTLALEGLQPSIDSVGDAYGNAAAETVMGLFINEAVAKDSPFRTGR